jgi:hypothetical protein
LGFAVTAGLADLVAAGGFDPDAVGVGVADVVVNGVVTVPGAVGVAFGVALVVGVAVVAAAACGVKRPTGSFRGLEYPTSATLAATAAATATATIKPIRTHVRVRFIATKRSRRGALCQLQSSPLPPP